MSKIREFAILLRNKNKGFYLLQCEWNSDRTLVKHIDKPRFETHFYYNKNDGFDMGVDMINEITIQELLCIILETFEAHDKYTRIGNSWDDLPF